MAVYVVTWNLNKERANYPQARQAFIQQLENFENIKDGGLESVRFISSTSSAEDITSFLHQRMDANDCLFVSKINRGEYFGWLSEPVWKWIEARL
jgi:hypothetical protein